MRLDDERESDNIEDQRGQGGGGFSFPGMGGGGMQLGGRGLGCGGIVVVIVLALVFGINPLQLLGGGGGVGPSTQQIGQPEAARTAPGQQSERDGFVRKVLATTEDSWAKILPEQANTRYTNPTLVLYSGTGRSACGAAQSAMGPFYCPNDKKVYLDTSFFNEMQAKYGGGGDFAYAYVVAHEIGHHVQDLLGILDKVDAAKQNASRTQANALSVRVELQADCLAGVWAYNANEKYRILDPGDIEKAVATAGAIGDDKLQTAARGYAVPDSFTHGTSALRQQWLTTGLKSGQVDSCNTFGQ